MRTRHISFRVTDRVFDRLERRRRETGQSRSHLATELLEEGLRMAEHPGIVFRPGPTGRRAALVGGPDVWEVIGVFRDVEPRGEEAIDRTSELASLTREQVRTAVRYYAEHQDEVDSWIDRTRAEAERAEAAWRREQRLLA